MYLLKLGDVLCEVVNHEFRILHDNVSNESVLGHLYLQLLLRLTQSQSNKTQCLPNITKPGIPTSLANKYNMLNIHQFKN